MLAVRLPGSFWPSCHTAPVWPDTLRAKPKCAPQPISGLDGFSVQYHLVSPHRYAVCAAGNHTQQQSHGLWGCHILYQGTGAVDSVVWAKDVPPLQPLKLPSEAWYRGHWLPPLQCSMACPLPPQGDSAWYRPWLDLWGWGQSDPPRTSLTH